MPAQTAEVGPGYPHWIGVGAKAAPNGAVAKGVCVEVRLLEAGVHVPKSRIQGQPYTWL